MRTMYVLVFVPSDGSICPADAALTDKAVDIVCADCVDADCPSPPPQAAKVRVARATRPICQIR